MKILAIDFETADKGRDSACAIGLAMLEGGRIVEEHYELIRPPSPDYSPDGLFGVGERSITD
jgi:DNA polymerase-3 subunit epsilon